MLKALFYISAILLTACTEKKVDHGTDSTTRLVSGMKNKQTDSVPSTSKEINLSQGCEDSLMKLVSGSDFIETLDSVDKNKWVKRWNKKGRFTYESDSDGRLIIHVYIKPAKGYGEGTLGWLAIDPRKMQFGRFDEENNLISLKYDSALLRRIVTECLKK
ncbi:MAG: hypothetical protein Q8916_13565 [Bacteroidota bacterium]|nr:hypothetical protein [Bacteroidota bacterium]MDP4237244.1 hypothetical protein [Bacteroidota bacterium]